MTMNSQGFAALGVPVSVVGALTHAGITEPFPIQTVTLPDSLAGRDVLGRGKTGSGKTIAFAIPTVVALANSTSRRKPCSPRALILVPTRELARQVAETVEPLASSLALRVSVVFGGVGQGPQVAAMKRGVDIVIACPGRLEDLITQRHCSLDAVEVTVLDEADHMADLGFLPVVKRLLDRTPERGQRLLFSATLDNGIDVLVKRYLDNPVTHSVDSAESPVSTMEHHVFAIATADKVTVLSELAVAHGRTLMFTRTKYGAKKLAKQLNTMRISAAELHGNLSQNARERNLEGFADGSVRVLVATDIAARGIHVDDVKLVIHADPPAEHKAYLHRSGRTARAGAEGVVVTLMTPDQASDVKSLARAAKINPTYTPVRPGDGIIRSIAVDGEGAEPYTPSAAPEISAEQARLNDWAASDQPGSRSQAPRQGASRPPRREARSDAGRGGRGAHPGGARSNSGRGGRPGGGAGGSSTSTSTSSVRPDADRRDRQGAGRGDGRSDGRPARSPGANASAGAPRYADSRPSSDPRGDSRGPSDRRPSEHRGASASNGRPGGPSSNGRPGEHRGGPSSNGRPGEHRGGAASNGRPGGPSSNAGRGRPGARAGAGSGGARSTGRPGDSRRGRA